MPSRRLGSAVLLVGPVVVLLRLAPPAGLLPAMAAAAHAQDGGTSLLLDVAALAAWAVSGWLLLGVVLAALANAPGAVGRTAAHAAERVTPAAVRALLAGGTAAGLAFVPAFAPVAARAASTCTAPVTTGGLPSLDRPVLGCPPVTTSARSPAAASRAPVRSSPSGSTTARSLPAPPAATPAPRPAGVTPAAVTTVRAGDTLWALAESELRSAGRPADPAAVAARWPAWWQANRAVIGPDPDLLQPGERLRPPPVEPRHEESR